MSKTLNPWLAGALVAVVVVGIDAFMLSGDRVSAKSERFTVGQTYLVVWDCLPIPSGPPCYTEELTVKAVHDDGWIDVQDETERRHTGKAMTWTANPLRMASYAIKPDQVVAAVE